MEYRPLGGTGVMVSALAMGTGSFSSDDHEGRQQADAKVGMALEAGVNLFDTADGYSGGTAEKLLGHALRTRRDEVLIATKVRYPTFPGVNGEGLSRQHITRSVEASLTRLGTDRIDLYQLHEWDGATPLLETFAASRRPPGPGSSTPTGIS